MPSQEQIKKTEIAKDMFHSGIADSLDRAFEMANYIMDFTKLCRSKGIDDETIQMILDEVANREE